MYYNESHMTLGKGLQSLIPPKKEAEEKEARYAPPSSVAPAPAERTEAGHASPAPVKHPSPQQPQGPRQEAVFQIEVEKIRPNPYQPRKEFNEEALEELAASIREFGVIQPLIVSKVIRETETGTKVEYQLIAGERRLKASKRAGLERVPAIVRKIDEGKVKLEMALIENVQRSDLNPLEAGKAYARLQDEFKLTQREIAARVGKSREVVANTLRLLNLPSYVQEALMGRKINESQARALLSVADPKEQERLFRDLLEGKTSVRRFREQGNVPSAALPEQNYWEKQLEGKLGAPVAIVKKGARGRIVIQFYSEEEMHSLLEKLAGEL